MHPTVPTDSLKLGRKTSVKTWERVQLSSWNIHCGERLGSSSEPKGRRWQVLYHGF